jgi:AcrR family transcriptional regulator
MAAPIINLHFVGVLTILDRTVQYCAMARQIEFDRSLARDKALVLFWRKGYQATSLADLLAAMEIGRSSFYAAFGDKRTLFLECLDLFAARTGAAVQRTRAALPPIDALQDFF